MGLDLSGFGDPCVCDHTAYEHRHGGDCDSACQLCACLWYRSVKKTQKLLPGWDMEKCKRATVQERYDGRASTWTCVDCGRVMMGNAWEDEPAEVFNHFRRSYTMRSVPHLDSRNFERAWSNLG